MYNLHIFKFKGLLWLRFASLKFSFGKGLLLYRIPSVKDCFFQGVLWKNGFSCRYRPFWGPKKPNMHPNSTPEGTAFPLYSPPLLEPILGPEKPNIVPFVYSFKGFKTQHYANKFALCKLFRRLIKTYNYACMIAFC